jgi:phage gp37-like protein
MSDTEPHGVTDGRCNWCGGLVRKDARALADNVNGLIENLHRQQRTTTKLFKICLEYLDESKWPKYALYGDGSYKAAKAAMSRRKERKKELIAAIHGYIKMIEERTNEDD